MADPVSWLLIEPGWRVDSVDGKEVGRVLEVTGDSDADIFDGFAIAFSMFAKPRYLPAEQVAEIIEGHVRLRLDRAGIERLTEFKEPAVEEQIEPEGASRVQRTKTAVAPASRRETPIPFLRRILLWFGFTGRR